MATRTDVKAPKLTSFAPQFLVDDLSRSIEYYEKLGFKFGEPWEGFYAIGRLDGLELHLKESPNPWIQFRQVASQGKDEELIGGC